MDDPSKFDIIASAAETDEKTVADPESKMGDESFDTGYNELKDFQGLGKSIVMLPSYFGNPKIPRLHRIFVGVVFLVAVALVSYHVFFGRGSTTTTEIHGNVYHGSVHIYYEKPKHEYDFEKPSVTDDDAPSAIEDDKEENITSSDGNDNLPKHHHENIKDGNNVQVTN